MSKKKKKMEKHDVTNRVRACEKPAVITETRPKPKVTGHAHSPSKSTIGQKGHIPWNKGRKGATPWNKGLKKKIDSPLARMTKETIDETASIGAPVIKPLAPVSPRDRVIVTWQANSLKGAEQPIGITGQMTLFTGKTVERVQEIVVRLVESHFHQLGVIGAGNCRIQIVSMHTVKKEK